MIVTIAGSGAAVASGSLPVGSPRSADQITPSQGVKTLFEGTPEDFKGAKVRLCATVTDAVKGEAKATAEFLKAGESPTAPGVCVESPTMSGGSASAPAAQRSLGSQAGVDHPANGFLDLFTFFVSSAKNPSPKKPPPVEIVNCDREVKKMVSMALLGGAPSPPDCVHKIATMQVPNPTG